MSVCPVPAKASKSDYSNPGSFTATPPDPKFEMCEGGTTTVVTPPGFPTSTTTCCPSPGPMGPAGPAGSLTLKKDGVVLGDITELDFTGTGFELSYAGGVGTFNGTSITWKGDWTDSFEYKKNDLVRNPYNNSPYICSNDHTSSSGDEPGIGSWWAQNWDVVVDMNAALPKETKTFLEELKDNVFDWMKNATVGDWLQALAIGAGVVWAGSKIMDMFSSDGKGDGNAGSSYNGSAGYNGSFTAPSLPVVIDSLMQFAGYDPTQFDVSMLPASEVHFTLNSTITVRAVLQQLAAVYQFDIVPSGGIVKFIPRNQAPVRTLTMDDLGHSDQPTSGGVSYSAKRTQGIDLPRSVTFTYYSAELDYNQFVQTATLETYEDGQDVKIDVPLTLVDADAKRITETALVNAHVEQQQYTFMTDYHNIDLEPGDVIDMPLDSGGTTRVRIIQVNETNDGLLEFTVVRADNNDLSYVVSPIDSALPPEQPTNTPTTIGYSQSLFLEVPPLSDNDTKPRLLVAVHGYAAPGWPGAIVYRSDDGGVNYEVAATTNKVPTIGLVASSIAAPSVYQIWDTSTTITVQLKQGVLNNSSDIAVQNGANWCMVGEEVIGFVNATLVGVNTYQLSRLLRGRAGSEVKCGTHVNNELFVLLDDQLTRIDLTSAELAQTVKYKTVTVGSDISKVDAEDMKPYGLNMRPWRVANPTAVKQPNGDWLISWKERPRYNNQLQDYNELTHDTDWAGYGIAFLSGSTVKSSATTTGNSYTYTVNQQGIDFGGPQSSITVSITQMSTIVGGGYPYVVNA